MNQDKIKRITDLRSNYHNEDEEGKRTYLIQLENLSPKPTKTLFIDADGLIYYAAYSSNNNSSVPKIEGNFIGNPVDTTNDLIATFHSIVNNVVSACKTHSLLGNMVTFKDYKLVFTPKDTFRYSLFPDYKISRRDRESSNDEVILKKYAYSIGMIVDNVEADDVVSYYGKHGHPIASGDKDVINGVPGKNFYYHPKHFNVVNTSEDDAHLFMLMQTLAGDSADDIPGIKGVGMKNKLLKDISNPTFENVIDIYIDKGLTKEDAILTRQLVDMHQWKGFIRGLKVFQYKGNR